MVPSNLDFRLYQDFYPHSNLLASIKISRTLTLALLSFLPTFKLPQTSVTKM
jgi:hypothetical protein